jgi:hypothetical protein
VHHVFAALWQLVTCVSRSESSGEWRRTWGGGCADADETVRYDKPHVQQSSECVVSLVIKLVTSRWVFVCAVRRQRAFGVIAATQLGPCSLPPLSGGVVLGLWRWVDFDAKDFDC